MFLLETIQRESVIRFPFLGNLTLNPPASFSVFGREIYFYGVIIALGFVLGILYCRSSVPGSTSYFFRRSTISLIPQRFLRSGRVVSQSTAGLLQAF